MTASAANAGMTVNQYLALRVKLSPKPLVLEQVKQDPSSYLGRTFEMRGVVHGLASNPEGLSIIIAAYDGESYVLAASKDCGLESGMNVSALVRVGENCATSLTDLRLTGSISLFQIEQKEKADSATRKVAEVRKQQIEADLAARKKFLTSVSASSVTKCALKKDCYTTSRGRNEVYQAYRDAVAKFNKKLSPTEVEAITASILEFSRRQNVDPRLVIAVILAESHFNPYATSHAGAMGLGQLMPRTAKGMGVSNAYDPVANIEAAVKLIKSKLTKYSGSSDWNDLDWSHIQLALAAYNAGPGAVKKYGGVPPYRETRNYIRKVISYYKDLCGMN